MRQQMFHSMLLSGLVVATLAVPVAAAAAPPITWTDKIPWVPFDTALEQARAENKAICVVIYADWCPKCRGLAPAFEGPPITDAAGQVIMVLQDSEERPEWLTQRFGDLGNYVPRVFFLRPDGTLNNDVNSGHAKFPLFYTPGKAQLLADNMRAAAKAAGGPAVAAPPQPPASPQPIVSPQPIAAAQASAPGTEPAAVSEGLGGDYGLLVLIGLLVVIGLVVTRLGRKTQVG